MVLESVYEQDFLPCSFGFRPVARLTRHCSSCALPSWAKDYDGWSISTS